MPAFQSTSPTDRGQRAKSIRLTLRYSRRALAKKHEIKATTLQNWEDGRYGGLTEKGARLLAQIYQAEGLDCRPEWLLYGIGPNPIRLMPSLSAEAANHSEPYLNSERLFMTEELNLFKLNHHDSIDTIVADDGMVPGLWPGDHVAGERYFHEDISKVLHAPCIVQLASGQTLTRVLQTSGTPGTHQLVCTNPNTRVAEAVLNNIVLLSAAPILWVRRAPQFYQSK